MPTHYRKDRKRWGFRVCLQGRTYKQYAWQTKAAAKQAEADFLADLKKNPPLPKNAFVNVVGGYLIHSAKYRSQWRLDALRRNFARFIVPFFGDTTPAASINKEQVEDFIEAQKKRGVKNITVWHYVKDLRACCNWAMRRKGLLNKNPVVGADLSTIKDRKANKPPLDPRIVDRAAASIDNPVDRAWFDVTRFTGMRKDEANRLEWTDVNFELGMIRYPGTKTEESKTWLPLAPVVLKTLAELRKVCTVNDLVFPGRSYQTRGKKIYSRRRMFERIKKKTGIKLMPKDLRDYFASEIAARVNDPAVVMKLLRHTSLETTTKYLRTVNDRLEAAVSTLGASLGGRYQAQIGRKTTQNDSDEDSRFTPKPLVSRESNWEKVGGRRRARTSDLAHVRRGDSPSNPSETQADNSVEADSGGNLDANLRENDD